VPTAELRRQQRAILQGVLEFAANRNLFLKAQTPVSDFVVRILSGQFSRDRRFDEEAVAGLSDLLRTKVNDLDYEYAVEFADRLLDDIERGLNVDAVGQPGRFGAGSVEAVRILVDTLHDVFATVTRIVRENPGFASHLRSSRSLESFQKRAATVLPRFLAVADEGTQIRAINAMRVVAAEAAVPAVIESGMIGRLTEYGKHGARTLGSVPKSALAQVFNELGQRADAVSSPTLVALSENVEWIKGQQRPLWFTMFGKDEVDALVATMGPASVASKGQIEFVGSVIAAGGAKGKSPGSAAKAVEVYQEYLAKAAEPVAREDAAALREAARQSPYPAVLRRAERALGARGF
jgi:hypothetical protein